MFSFMEKDFILHQNLLLLEGLVAKSKGNYDDV